MLNSEEKKQMQNLPVLKGELTRKKQLLDQLQATEGSISEEKFRSLKDGYEKDIEQIQAQIDSTIQFLQNKIEDFNLEAVDLKKRREQYEEDFAETDKLKEAGAISDEDYKAQKKIHSGKLKEIDNKLKKIRKDFEQIEHYLQAEPAAPSQKSDSVLSPLKNVFKNSSSKSGGGGEGRSNTIYIIGAVAALIVIVLIVNSLIGLAAAGKIEEQLDDNIDNLKTILEYSDDEYDIDYRKVSVNPLASTIAIKDVEFKFESEHYYYDYKDEISVNVGKMSIKAPLGQLKKSFEGEKFKIKKYTIELADVEVNVDIEDTQSKFSTDKLSLTYKGEITDDLVKPDPDKILDFVMDEHKLILKCSNFQIAVDGDIDWEEEEGSEILYLDKDKPQIKSLNATMTLDDGKAHFSAKMKALPFDAKADIKLEYGVDKWEGIESEFNDSEIVFYNLSREAKDFISVIEENSDYRIKSDKKVTIELDGDFNYPDIDIH